MTPLLGYKRETNQRDQSTTESDRPPPHNTCVSKPAAAQPKSPITKHTSIKTSTHTGNNPAIRCDLCEGVCPDGGCFLVLKCVCRDLLGSSRGREWKVHLKVKKCVHLAPRRVTVYARRRRHLVCVCVRADASGVCVFKARRDGLSLLLGTPA